MHRPLDNERTMIMQCPDGVFLHHVLAVLILATIQFQVKIALERSAANFCMIPTFRMFPVFCKQACPATEDLATEPV